MSIIGPLLGTIGGAVKAIFGFKKVQADVLQTGLKVLGDANASNAQREQAIAQIISTEASSGYPIAAIWRPLLMLFFAVLIGARWFGYMPPNMTEVELLEVYGLLKLGIGGYIGSRGLEKIVQQIGLAGVLKRYIEKKLV